MNQAQFTDWLKTTLGVVGSALASFGIGTTNGWMTVSGIIVTLAPFIWGLISNTHLAQVQSVAALPDVAKVVLKSSATDGLAAAAADPAQPKIAQL